jgi:hypothetical protein
MLLVRRLVLPRLRIHGEDSHFTGTMVHSVMVFYGLAVALIAVNVFETYADTTKVVTGEATAARTGPDRRHRAHEPLPGGAGQIRTGQRGPEASARRNASRLQPIQLIQARRMRLDAVGTGLPGVMWLVILSGRSHQPERLLLFQGRGCTFARDFSNASGNVYWARHLHDLRPRSSVPGRPGSATRTLSTSVRPPDETIAHNNISTERIQP